MDTQFSKEELEMFNRAGLSASVAGERLREIIIISRVAQKYSPLSSEKFFNEYRELCGIQERVNISDSKIMGILHQLACRGISHPGIHVKAIFEGFLKDDIDPWENMQTTHDKEKNTVTASLVTARFGKVHEMAYYIIENEWSEILAFAQLIESGE